MGDFDSDSVAFGLKEGEFASLPEPTRNKLVRLMSRISEASFRRGFQHGCVQTKKGAVKGDPSVLRFGRSLDKSPWAETASGGLSAKERLFCEYDVLDDIGFPPAAK